MFNPVPAHIDFIHTYDIFRVIIIDPFQIAKFPFPGCFFRKIITYLKINRLAVFYRDKIYLFCIIRGADRANWTKRKIYSKLRIMLHELTITVDDTVYKTLKPMVEQQTIGSFLYEFIQDRTKKRPTIDITALRGSLHRINTSNLRDEADRPL